MADFTEFEAEASDVSNDENDEMEVDNSLIDDAEEQENNWPSFFRFHNQTRNTDEVLRKIAEQEAIASQHMEASNYNECENEHMSLDEFENFELRRKKFLETLKNPLHEQTRENGFYSALLFAIKFNKTEDSGFCEEDELKEKNWFRFIFEITR